MRAGFFAPDWLIDNAGESATRQCKDRGIELECQKFSTTSESHTETYRSYRNIITWGFKMSHDWYLQDGRNVLFIENALLRQPSGVYIDDSGFFINSSIVKEEEWTYPFSDDELNKLKDHTKSAYGWDLNAGGDTDGPIMIIVQQRNDAPCKYHFKHRHGDKDPVEVLLSFCRKYLPDRGALVKPHPKFLDEWAEKEDVFKKYFRENWEMCDNKEPRDILKTCSAVVTINSSLATEVQLLGIPIATFGEGAYSKSKTVLECSDDPKKVSEILSFEPDLWRSAAYLCAVMRHQVSYDNFEQDLKNNRYFDRWCGKQQVDS